MPRKRNPKRRRNPAVPVAGAVSEQTLPQIVWGDECTWVIPTIWWTSVAEPRLRAYLAQIEAGSPTWPDKQAVLQQSFNSRDAAYRILSGATVPVCDLPGPGVSLTDQANMSPSQRNMANLMLHVIANIDAALSVYTQSLGSRFFMPEATQVVPAALQPQGSQ